MAGTKYFMITMEDMSHTKEDTIYKVRVEGKGINPLHIAENMAHAILRIADTSPDRDEFLCKFINTLIENDND